MSRAAFPARRDDLRNVAIIAHVDHGKTTLVDAMLWQAGSSARTSTSPSGSWTRSTSSGRRGITIMAKNTTIHVAGVKINIVDTPGHADFGGEVERALTMVDGVLLLVDASRGPAAADALRAAEGARGAPADRVVVNKIDRPDARADEVLNEVYDLFIDLDADEAQLEFPVVYATPAAARPRSRRTSSRDDLEPLFETLLATVPAPRTTRTHPLQALVTNLDGTTTSGGSLIGRVRARRAAQGRAGRLVPRRRHGRERKITVLYVYEGLERVPSRRGGAGRDRRHRRRRGDRDRRDDRRPETTRGRCRSSTSTSRRSRCCSAQHLAVRRHGRQQADLPPAPRALDEELRRQRLHPRRGDRRGRTPSECRAAASCSSRSSSR